MTPEQLARQKIDSQLEACGWIVQYYKHMNLMAGQGIAVREFPLTTGSADYMLYAGGKAIGVVEAKPEGYPLTGVEIQSKKYTEGLPPRLPTWRVPLPFAYETTGTITQFTSTLDPEPRSRETFAFHRPEELLRLVSLSKQLRAGLHDLPPLEDPRLWAVQADTIRKLETSLRANRPRALIQMATGSGKTFTACSFCYRLLAHAKAKRILFLVDRNNLGSQTFDEFQQYVGENNYTFTEEYPVQHLRKNAVDPASKVVITTIQRLYSILKGEEDFSEENEETSMFESGSPLVKEAIPVVYNKGLPIEHFDFIVIDECHRSIYNVWRQVLEYFDAFLVGLTATPTTQTIGFFYDNVVQDYSHERAVADGVNVGYEVYRIATKISTNGATLPAQVGRFIPRRDRRTKAKRYAELEDDLTYTATDLDRDVVNPSQIRTVIRAFKDNLFTEIFPDRKETPKTLVFAKTDQHAEDIVKIIREEFGRGNDFCVKITSKTTGRKPKDLLNEFRNSYMPRIAVTVDMIATGTDVKPLECLLFMRNIASASYFDQMKGRGTRVIGEDDIRRVSPDTNHKTHFVIVDAVGVCVSDKTCSKPLDRKPSSTLKDVLTMVMQGMVHADIVSTLAARLSRMSMEVTKAQADEITNAAGGQTLHDMVATLLGSIDADNVVVKAVEKFHLPLGQEPSEEQMDAAEFELMSDALKPFHDPKLRTLIIDIKAQLEQVIDEITKDVLTSAGFDAVAKIKARSLLDDFQRFCQEHAHDIEAIKLLYQHPYRAGLRYSHVKELAELLKRPPLNLAEPEKRLWRLYEVLEPERVKGAGGKSLVDLIALVRHALHPEAPIVPHGMDVEERYRKWLEERAGKGVVFSGDQMKWLDAIKNHIATSLGIDKDSFDDAPFAQMGGLGKVWQVFGPDLEGILKELNERLAA